MTRATMIWFVGAAIVGVVAGGLHLLRSAIGGSHTGLPLAVAAFALTALAALMLFHGVMLAAREQDVAAARSSRAANPRERVDPYARPDEDDYAVDDYADEDDQRWAPAARPAQQRDEPLDRSGDGFGGGSHDRPHDQGPDVYTFRGGKPVVERGARPARRDRPSRG
jgi:hypothetical protein